MRLMRRPTGGYESVGVILRTAFSPRAWWMGSTVSVPDAKSILGTEDFDAAESNVTVVQVAAGAIAGLEWIIRNPNRGLVLPEDMRHETPLQTAANLLGNNFSLLPISSHRFCLDQ